LSNILKRSSITRSYYGTAGVLSLDWLLPALHLLSLMPFILTRRSVYQTLQMKTLSYMKRCLVLRQAICHVKVRSCWFLHAGFFLRLNSYSEDGGDMFPETFGWPLI
jgi:hypothetical protein